MSRTVSTKQTTVLSEQCSQCRLWFQYLHPAADGRRFLCAVCVRLEGGNRSTERVVQVAAGQADR
jgi:hypothetical protein